MKIRKKENRKIPKESDLSRCLGRSDNGLFDVEQTETHGGEFAKNFGVVHDAGLTDQTFNETDESQRFLRRITGLDHTGGDGITNGRFIVAALAGDDFTNRGADVDLLGADLGTQRTHRATE